MAGTFDDCSSMHCRFRNTDTQMSGYKTRKEAAGGCRVIINTAFVSLQLCKYAEEWANYLTVKGLLEHRPSSPYGENLFCCWTSLPNHRIDGREPVDSWYEEIKFHPFGREPTTLKSGDSKRSTFIL